MKLGGHVLLLVAVVFMFCVSSIRFRFSPHPFFAMPFRVRMLTQLFAFYFICLLVRFFLLLCFVAFCFSRCRVLFVPLFIFFVILCLWFPLPCPFVVSCVCLSVVTVVFTRQSSFSLNPHPANSAVAAPAPGQAFPLYVKCSPPGKFSAS